MVGYVATQGADEAGDRIASLDVFKKAQNVKVDPDKPLQQARYVTLKVRLYRVSLDYSRALAPGS